MRIMLRLVFSVLVFSLATLVSADSGWAKSFGQIASKHTRYQGKCLEADATGDWIIRLRDCDATKAQQWWFVTRAYPSDGTLKTDETIRSVMWPNRCMTDVDLGLDQGRVMVLRSCFDDGLTSSQLWEPKSLRRRIGTNGKCVSVAESKGFVRNCDRDSKRQRFDLTNVAKVTNFDLGDFIKDHPNVDLPEVHRFRDYADCAEQNQNETTCFINAGDEGKYGFRFGTEIDKLDRVPGFSGTQGGGDKVLDLGDRYSADRCALAHDRWYWASEDAANEEDFQIRPPTAFQEITIFKPDAAVLGGWQNWEGMLDCLETVRPTTVQENNAIEVADAFISGLISGLKVRYPDTKFGSCRSAQLPGDGAPILDCDCRLAINSSVVDEERIADLCHVEYRDVLEAAVGPDGSMPDWLPEVAGPAYIAWLVERAQPAPDPAPEPEARVFAEGDWVWRIGVEAGAEDVPVYVAEFETLNPGVDADKVYAGQRYLLPPP